MVKQLLAMPLPKVVFKYLGVIFIVDSEETALLTSRVGMAVLRVMLKAVMMCINCRLSLHFKN